MGGRKGINGHDGRNDGRTSDFIWSRSTSTSLPQLIMIHLDVGAQRGPEAIVAGPVIS